MATRPKKRGLKIRTSPRGDMAAMRAALADVVVRTRPRAEPIPCSTTPTTVSGEVDLDMAYTRSSPDMVILIFNGLQMGSNVPVTWTKTATGYSFEGWRPGCYVEKCSNGAPSKEQVWVEGTVDTTSSTAKLTLGYENHSLCGDEVTCIETGTFVGNKVSPGADPLDADYWGVTTWKRSCCPDREWKFAVDAPPQIRPRGAFEPAPRSGPRRRSKTKRKRPRRRVVAKRRRGRRP